ncbi:capsule biosynthesis GfcC family protein [Marinomonas communis]|uniref:capsule biosynthesis GfcC family protein n=1 Tax=Marinomonas communis TaxID=28254 RepID=UPI001D17F146|nr:capsule biosynthesis GfcC family protein [Marinomonas communis]MCC4275257.1 capsule biosynthesis GfcC family protein [Marinomonas communis]
MMSFRKSLKLFKPFPDNLKIFSLALMFFVANDSKAQETAFPTYITLLPSQALLSYSQNVRWGQVLLDAYSQSESDVYALGVSLIDPHKQPMIEVQKQRVLRQLMLLNTPETLNVARQINSLKFAYQKPVESSLIKVQGHQKRNPLLNQEYWLYLPERPEYIKLVSPKKENITSLNIKYNVELRDYLADFSGMNKGDQPYNTVWIIQADRKTYQVNELTWSDKIHYLSPGAIVFTGLQDLPYEFRNLNGDIAQLLSHRLEL